MRDINFSIVITARGNPDWLLRCITSFIETAKYPDKNEIIIMIDYDDHDNIDILKRPIFTTQNIHTIIRPQSGKLEPFNMTSYYVNYGAQHSSGKYVWGVNAECKSVTNNWDAILLAYFDVFFKDKPDKLLYVTIYDDVHIGKPSSFGTYKILEAGCCFPICSRESINAVGFFMPPELTFWGADLSLYEIYRSLIVCRIIFLPNIQLRNLSTYNDHFPDAEASQRRFDRNASLSTGTLSEQQKQIYIQKLNSHILRNLSPCNLIEQTPK